MLKRNSILAAILISVILAVCSAAYLLDRRHGPDAPAGGDLRVRRVTVVDADDRPLIVLGSADQGASITLLDRQGRGRLMITLLDDFGPMISLWADRPRPEVMLSTVAGGTPLAVADAAGVMRNPFSGAVADAPTSPADRPADRPETIVARFSGSAAITTDPFEAPATWTISWSACDKPAMVMVLDADHGSFIDSVSTGDQASGSSRMHHAGRHYLKIMRTARCDVTVSD